jgi:hypothetical protein
MRDQNAWPIESFSTMRKIEAPSENDLNSFTATHRTSCDSWLTMTFSFSSASNKKRTSKCQCPGKFFRAGIGWMSRSKIPLLSSLAFRMPVSSASSRKATFKISSSPSAWPPGWSHLSNLLWWSNSTRVRDGLATQAEPVM